MKRWLGWKSPPPRPRVPSPRRRPPRRRKLGSPPRPPPPGEKVPPAPPPQPATAVNVSSQPGAVAAAAAPAVAQPPSGDPAPMSDSESDAFSRLGTATFKDGALHIQFGRKVKTRRPKVLLAGLVDLMTLRRASV